MKVPFLTSSGFNPLLRALLPIDDISFANPLALRFSACLIFGTIKPFGSTATAIPRFTYFFTIIFSPSI
ncbi:MAG: hypothetical protein QM487_16000 [Candidatus Marithrix sp.]